MLAQLDEKQLAGDTICEKARKLYSNLLQENPSTRAMDDEFKSGGAWLDKFCKTRGILHVTGHSEGSSSDQAAAEASKKELAKFIKAEGHVTQQVSYVMKQGSSGRLCQAEPASCRRRRPCTV